MNLGDSGTAEFDTLGLAQWNGVRVLQKTPIGLTDRSHATTQVRAAPPSSRTGLRAFQSAPWSDSIGLNRRCFIGADRGATVKIGNASGFSGVVIAVALDIRSGNGALS